MRRVGLRDFVLATSALAGLLLPSGPAAAQDAETRMNAIEQQIRSLQEELKRVRRDLAQRDAQVRAAQQEAAKARSEAHTAAEAQARQPVPLPPPGAAPGAVPGQQAAAAQPPEPPLPKGAFRVGGGVTVTLGGFIELAGIFRTRNQNTDIASNWNTGIPYPYQTQYHQTEFRGSARQTRLSLLMQGDIDPSQKIAGYIESDFQGAGTNSNSNESNSYTPRLRQAYGQYDNTQYGWHVLAGQAWSLLTLNKVGIEPRQEDVPLTIDAQYVPGFTWTRQPQLRVAKDLDDHKLWLALSLESPQTVFYTGPNGYGVGTSTVTTSYPGTGGLSSASTYSADVAPDVIVKAAYDPGFGHYEAYGLLRFMQDRVSGLGHGKNNIVPAGGGGLGVILPVLGDKLQFQASALAGAGIGRYGSAQLPDAAVGSAGQPIPLPEVEALVGVIGHPTPNWDIYGYVGTEQIGSKYFNNAGKGYGYGSPLYSNAGCQIELSPAATCIANTSGIVQGTIGAWWRFLHGNYGTIETGAQYSYTKRSIFKGVGGSPETDENVILLSLRYLPFQ